MHLIARRRHSHASYECQHHNRSCVHKHCRIRPFELQRSVWIKSCLSPRWRFSICCARSSHHYTIRLPAQFQDSQWCKRWKESPVSTTVASENEFELTIFCWLITGTLRMYWIISRQWVLSPSTPVAASNAKKSGKVKEDCATAISKKMR